MNRPNKVEQAATDHELREQTENGNMSGVGILFHLDTLINVSMGPTAFICNYTDRRQTVLAQTAALQQ